MELHDTGHEETRVETVPVPRRKVLAWLVGAINAGIAAVVVLPTLGFVAAPLKRKREPGAWVPVLDDAELAEGQTKAVTYEVEVRDGYMMTARKYSTYVQKKGGKVIAYDPSCPHLGCHVEFKDRKKRFVCPCHGGVFDEEGNVLSGPPPRGLTKVEAKVEGGRIYLFRGEPS